MKRQLLMVILLTGISVAGAQQSDFATKEAFESRYKGIAARIDSARSTAALDSLRSEVTALELAYAPSAAFLDKALYPVTFNESMDRLKKLEVLTYDRVYLIQTQGVRLVDLELAVGQLTTRLDSLTAQRDQLFGELQESKKSVTALRDLVKRLNANLLAKDKLIFALVDSIFLPYGKNVQQAADVQKEAISQKLEKANVVTRIYEVAADNVRFLDVTQLQGRDYSVLLDQYQAFSNRWSGLRDKLEAVAAVSATQPPTAVITSPAKGSKAAGTAKETPAAPPHNTAQLAATQAGHIDSVLVEWKQKLVASFWSNLSRDLSKEGVGPFNDAPSFSNAIRTQVATLKSGSQDPGPFVDVVWKEKVDREWRDALCRDNMLGKAEYASLDKLVSELGREPFDPKLILYVGGVLLVIMAIWYFGFHKVSVKPEA
jgi:hypothetical protein